MMEKLHFLQYLAKPWKRNWKKMFCNMLEYMKLQNINDFYLFTDTTCNYGFYEHQGMNRCDEKSKTF